jgi:hypothetical protein
MFSLFPLHILRLRLVLPGLLLSALLLSPIAHALTVFEFTGTIDFDEMGFSDGDLVTGRLAYDESATDSSPTLGFGDYGPGIASLFEFSVAGNDLVATDLSGSDLVVDLLDAGQDRVTFRALGSAFDAGVSSCNDVAQCLVTLDFIDFGKTVLAGNNPLDAIPSVAQLAAFPVLFGNIIGPSAGGGGGASLSFTVTEIHQGNAVPLPATPALMVLAMLTLMTVRRRRLL